MMTACLAIKRFGCKTTQLVPRQTFIVFYRVQHVLQSGSFCRIYRAGMSLSEYVSLDKVLSATASLAGMFHVFDTPMCKQRVRKMTLTTMPATERASIVCTRFPQSRAASDVGVPTRDTPEAR